MANDSDEKDSKNGNGAAAPDGGGAKADEPPPAQATVEDLITELEQQVHKLEQSHKEVQDRLLRTAADFENFKRRAKKEIDEAQAKGREQIAKDMLPVLDNLERALKHAPADDPLAKGVQMVEKQLMQALEKHGVTRFSAVGQPFDPAMHDAIQQIETAEVPAGTVAQEFARGYMMNGKLLRAAMVGVAKAPEGGAESAS
jgi:molecular chaperone GrpE